MYFVFENKLSIFHFSIYYFLFLISYYHFFIFLINHIVLLSSEMSQTLLTFRFSACVLSSKKQNLFIWIKKLKAKNKKQKVVT